MRPSTIAAGYVVAAGFWIFSSGLVLDGLVGRDGGLRSLLEQAKGFAFVGVTGTILWLVLRRFETSIARLAAHSARLAQFPQLSPNPVVELDAAGEIVSVNLAASMSLRGQGEGVADVLPPDYAAITRECIATGAARTHIPTSRDGRAWEWTFFPVGNPDGAYAFGSERTEQDRLQAQVHQAARMESVGRMAAGVAHDLNNILTAIGGYASLARLQAEPDAGPNEDLDGISTEVERASLLVKKLLSISRMRAPEAEIRRIEVHRHVQELRGTLRHLVPRRVTLRMESVSDEAWVDVDVAQFEQALLNLVANAVDAIPEEGEVTVVVRATEDGVAVCVRDSGTGIDPEVLPKIFDPFFTTKDEGLGTGLGLASVQAFARRSGGAVDVASAPGAGTSIAIRLPVVEKAAA